MDFTLYFVLGYGTVNKKYLTKTRNLCNACKIFVELNLTKKGYKMKKIFVLTIFCLVMAVLAANVSAQIDTPAPEPTATPVPTVVPIQTETPTPTPDLTPTPEPTEEIAKLRVIKVDVVYRDKPNEDMGRLNGVFIDNDGIDFENDDISVSIGKSTTTIPHGSFVKKSGTSIVFGSSFKGSHKKEDGEDAEDDDNGKGKGNGHGKGDDDNDDDSSEDGDSKDKDDGDDDESSDENSKDKDENGETEAGWFFEGEIDGSNVKMVIKIEESEVNAFAFDFEAENIDLSGSENPIRVSLEIGSNILDANVRLNGELKFRREKEGDDGKGDEEDEDGEDMEESEDSDEDGVSDEDDDCSDSNLTETVVIDDCNTGVKNTVLDNGCSILDLIERCAEEADNHGQFVKCVSGMTNKLRQKGIITGSERGRIQQCAALADIP